MIARTVKMDERKALGRFKIASTIIDIIVKKQPGCSEKFNFAPGTQGKSAQ